MSNEVENKMPAWEVMMRVINPKSTRPRRTSLHTIATMIGHNDILALAKEIQDSGKVVGYRCPDVSALIFYLIDLCKLPGMIDTRRGDVWGMVPAFLKEQPFPKIKGFKRFANGNSGMTFPYEKEDFPLAIEIIKALRAAGYTPGLSEEDLVVPYERPPCYDCDHYGHLNVAAH